MNEAELLKRVDDLECEVKRLRKKLYGGRRHSTIKTKKEDIVDYWFRRVDECGLSVDHAEADKRCWRCGYESNLQRSHIIPESLGGKDEPANLVLLCARCHIDAPNVESKTFMWDWIKANGTPFYDTFWYIRAQKEYEFVYGKSFAQELADRDIISYYDLYLFRRLKIGKSTYHFAHPWNNESTDAGLLRMRLEEFDRLHPIIKKKSLRFREKEKAFESFVLSICELAEKYNFNVRQGRSRNRFSITISKVIDRDKKLCISIKLFKDNNYRGCYTDEVNPNNNRCKDYVIDLGGKEEAINFVTNELKKFVDSYGMPLKQDYVLTVFPFYHN